MKQPEIYYWITCMLETFCNVSDQNITVGKTLQIESSGQFTNTPVKPHVTELTPSQAKVFELIFIGGDPRFLEDLETTGFCDLSYWLGNKRRSGPNIFKHKNHLFQNFMSKFYIDNLLLAQ